jgi:hypothetical protein
LKRPLVRGWRFFPLVMLITIMWLLVAVAGIGCPGGLSADGVDE